MERHAHPGAFLAAAGRFLQAREALHNLVLGVTRMCIEDPSRYPGPNYFATAHEGGGVVGVALMTSPHRLQVFVPAGAGTQALLEGVVRFGAPVSGVHGSEANAAAFAEAWCARFGGEARAHMRLRSFALTEVTPAPPTSGAMRAATRGDLALVAAWFERFFEDTGAHTGGMSAAAHGERAVLQGRAFLWQDGQERVCPAITAAATQSGARIGGVYTPPEHRRHGYATALVGALSQHLLGGGKTWCALYTDLANPISNSIYPKVGYRPIGDFIDIDFLPASVPGTKPPGILGDQATVDAEGLADPAGRPRAVMEEVLQHGPLRQRSTETVDGQLRVA